MNPKATVLTPARFTEGFEEVFGKHPGARRFHPKGVGVTGYFDSNGQGERISYALAFRAGRMPVIGRFSFGGGLPNVADAPGLPRGLGVQITQPDGELWRMSMLSVPIFLFPTPEAFYEQMLASKPDPKTGQPDPALMQDFLKHHPEFERVMAVVQSQPVPSGFANTTFHALNAFLFTNSEYVTLPVRWKFVPDRPFAAADMAPSEPRKNYLFDALIADIHRQPLRWRLILVVGQPGDPTHDSTIAWPADREEIDAGTLVLDHVESDDTAPSTDTPFNPLVLPAGIAPSDDPILSTRGAVYGLSYTRRASEVKEASAISPREVQQTR